MTELYLLNHLSINTISFNLGNYFNYIQPFDIFSLVILAPTMR